MVHGNTERERKDWKMKWKNITLHKKSFLVISCLLGILLLQSSIMSVQAQAKDNWIVKLSQSEDTTAQIYNCYFTKDGEDVGGNIDSLICDDTVSTARISKDDLDEDPNDFHYSIDIWWADGDFEQHLDEEITAPGSKKYTHSPDEVVVEVYPVRVGGVWVPVDKFGLLASYIGLASTILVATAATGIYVKRVKRRKEKQ